jgi:CheY-like chemotaxis protein
LRQWEACIATGLSALQAIDIREHLCGLITDVNLGGGIDGWEVARHARAKIPIITVAFITGDSASQWSVKGAPESLVLQKPFADAQVAHAIATLLNIANSANASSSTPHDGRSAGN